MFNIPKITLAAGLSLALAFTSSCIPNNANEDEHGGGSSETEIQWEEKIYWTGTIDEDFDGKRVLVVMDKNIGGPNKVHDKSFFGDIEIESIEDLTLLPENYDRINWETWRQILCLTLPGDSKENVVRVIRQLEIIDGIRSASPNYRGSFL